VPKVFAANADPGRTANCHLRDAANPESGEVIAFRDALRADPATRDAYAALKRDLAARCSSIEEYAAAKTPFIASVLGP
jgi:dephospho-CoA kinase